MESITSSDEKLTDSRPKYYEIHGRDKANANKAWLLAFLSIPIALLSLCFAVYVRLQPPAVYLVGPDGESWAAGKPPKKAVVYAAGVGTDEFANEAFAKKFLQSYLNYTPATIDEHWAASLNMMTNNLRKFTLKKLSDDNTRTSVDDEQIQSEFHLKYIEPVKDAPLSFEAFGVKYVRRITNGTERSDRFVGEYQIRLLADHRTADNPDGLWIAEFMEKAIDGERRDRILASPDQQAASVQ